MSLPAATRGALLAVALCIASIAPADEVDDLMDGFEDDDAELPEIPDADTPRDRLYSYHGSISLGALYYTAQHSARPGETDWRGFGALRLRGEFEADLDLPVPWPGDWALHAGVVGFRNVIYALRDRDDYSHDVKQTSEADLDLGEAWLRGSLLRDLDFKVGRQIVNWGRSDNLRVLDVINPLDNREPGLLDIEDLRMPLAMTRLDYYRGPFSITGLAIHERRDAELPGHGSAYFPSASPNPGTERRGNGGSNTEWAVALRAVFSGWDASLHWARYFEEIPHLEMFPAGGAGAVIQRHNRLTLIGAGGNLALGNFLLRTEVASIDGLEYLADPGDRKRRLDALIGVEYSGFTDQFLTLEALNRRVSGIDTSIRHSAERARENQFQWAARYDGDFWNATLHASVLGLVLGPKGRGGYLVRATAEYDVNDSLAVSGGIVIFGDGNAAPFPIWHRNDLLYIDAKLSF
jgi:hypothetical protein